MFYCSIWYCVELSSFLHLLALIFSAVLPSHFLQDFDQINPDELMKKQMETMEREKREAQDRLKTQEKKVKIYGIVSIVNKAEFERILEIF